MKIRYVVISRSMSAIIIPIKFASGTHRANIMLQQCHTLFNNSDTSCSTTVGKQCAIMIAIIIPIKFASGTHRANIMLHQ